MPRPPRVRITQSSKNRRRVCKLEVDAVGLVRRLAALDEQRDPHQHDGARAHLRRVELVRLASTARPSGRCAPPSRGRRRPTSRAPLRGRAASSREGGQGGVRDGVLGGSGLHRSLRAPRSVHERERAGVPRSLTAVANLGGQFDKCRSRSRCWHRLRSTARPRRARRCARTASRWWSALPPSRS